MFLKIALNFQVVSDLSAYSYIFDTRFILLAEGQVKSLKC
jgi:hypothetical protein